ncbi:MAG: GPR endopeptidase [Oscillospiraceae bacterium]|nr:GPR endopeptidase [Oscillospiraceae bacterium]
MNSRIRTDLAMEADVIRASDALPAGVRAIRRRCGSFSVATVEVRDRRGAAALGKPIGTYVTLELDAYLRREENAFSEAAQLLAAELRALLPLKKDETCLVAGLGNRGITPDAIGPASVDYVMVTRHLTDRMPEAFAAFRPVCAVCSGVLGTTGIESSDLIRAIVERFRPSAVIAVDALASREPQRLCRTVQLSDTGIIPGSGVGNARQALNCETLGLPVIAVGVPTVVDAATLTLDLAASAGADIRAADFGEAGAMIVTPRDIDKNVRDAAKLIGYGLNLALHDGLTVEDVDMFLS